VTNSSAPVPHPYLKPLPPPRTGPRRSGMAVATDTVAGLGLVAGILLSAASLYALIQKYRTPPAAPPTNE
jgi:hypothetical protein